MANSEWQCSQIPLRDCHFDLCSRIFGYRYGYRRDDAAVHFVLFFHRRAAPARFAAIPTWRRGWAVSWKGVQAAGFDATVDLGVGGDRP